VPTLSNPPAHQTGGPITALGSAGVLILDAGLTKAQYPVIASNGDDTTGTGPSLYTISSTGTIIEFPGQAGVGQGASPLSSTPTTIGTVTAGSITQLS
jgi:hypothetical protein